MDRDPVDTVDLNVTDRLRVKVGTFEADINCASLGSVTLDGAPIRCRAFTVRVAVDRVPEVTIDLVP